MARLGWTWVAVAASLAAAEGCASHRREQRASTQGAASSQAQRTATQAAQTEQQLAQARQRLEVAHRNAVA
ncbi:MAG TPA: hypothetical protein VF875_03685, partial [Anaeromyxobacter sp.]